MDTNKSSQVLDATLVQEYVSGSEIAIEKLINRHQLRIFNYIKSKVLDRDTAEDIFQDTPTTPTTTPNAVRA